VEKGSKNTNADILSRFHVTEMCPENKNQKVQITPDEKLKIFQEMQEKRTGGHLRINRIYDRIKLFTS
jgi:hypothetical protein